MLQGSLIMFVAVADTAISIALRDAIGTRMVWNDLRICRFLYNSHKDVLCGPRKHQLFSRMERGAAGAG